MRGGSKFSAVQMGGGKQRSGAVRTGQQASGLSPDRDGESTENDPALCGSFSQAARIHSDASRTPQWRAPAEGGGSGEAWGRGCSGALSLARRTIVLAEPMSCSGRRIAIGVAGNKGVASNTFGVNRPKDS